jgi:hypothetical protein
VLQAPCTEVSTPISVCKRRTLPDFTGNSRFHADGTFAEWVSLTVHSFRQKNDD